MTDDSGVDIEESAGTPGAEDEGAEGSLEGRKSDGDSSDDESAGNKNAIATTQSNTRRGSAHSSTNNDEGEISSVTQR